MARIKPSRRKVAGSAKAAALPRKSEAQKARAAEILRELRRHYPDAHCELNFTSPHELLIATILSAQATDVAVNKATPALFKAFPTPADYVRATPQQIEPYVRSLGFFRMKAKAIHGAMTTICENFGGKVPETMDELLSLRGVARKTANVVLGNAFARHEGVVVDTHVIRLVKRLGLSKHTDPRKIELDLMALFPRDSWTMLSHMLIFHGRRACRARGALCDQHPLCAKYCSNAKAAGKSPRGRGRSVRRSVGRAAHRHNVPA
jgi:endonuclease-3